MSARPRHDRSHLSGASPIQSAQFTQPSTTPEPRASSYMSLDKALLPASTKPRDDRDHLNQPQPRGSRSSLSAPTMATDNRYYSQQDPNAPYAYAQYPPYDAAQYPPNSTRPIRNGSSHPHPAQPQPPQPPPPQTQYATHPPPSPYSQPAYPTTPYTVPHPQSQAQWTPDGWQHYQQPFPPPQNQQIPQEQQYNSRAETQQQQPAPAGETRAPSAGSSKADNRRTTEERAERPPEAAPQPKARKGKEPLVEPPAPTPLPQASAQLGLDYNKLIESYRLIIDSSNAIGADIGAGRHGGYAETIERMLGAASYGAQALESATKRSASDAPRAAPTNGERSHEEGDGGVAKARQANVNKTEVPVEGGQTCLGCGATSTPEWRRGPMGPRTLCNACGLVYAKLIKKRTREPGRSRGSGHAKHAGQLRDGLSSGDDGSDDDSNGSQGRRSEMADPMRRGV